MIYIDFEQLGTSNARPALLGELAVRDNASADFTIYLLDPLLARAAVANRACRVADLPTALSKTLARDGAIVTWSEHDLRIVQNARLPAALVRPFEGRWVNALADVRRWKNRLYRDWNLPPLDQAACHALKVYMKAVGYDVPHTLAPGSAARWLRHVLERLESTGGDYRELSASAKRHWHALLEYNRHDCAGMRAVYERASRELALEAAYRQTTYRVEMGGASYPIRTGRRHRSLDAALFSAGARRWACITAHNPQSVQLSARENKGRDAALKRKLRARGIRWYPAAALGDAGDWSSELGVLALSVSRGWAETTGREFDQAAVVWGRVGGNAELVWCNRLQKVTRRSR
jgi:Protein of unknown function (DUF3293)